LYVYRFLIAHKTNISKNIFNSIVKDKLRKEWNYLLELDVARLMNVFELDVPFTINFSFSWLQTVPHLPVAADRRRILFPVVYAAESWTVHTIWPDISDLTREKNHSSAPCARISTNIMINWKVTQTCAIPKSIFLLNIKIT